MSLRTERLLAAPILPTLARLSAPGLLLVAFQSLVSIGDSYFVGKLGTEPLAGLALVFPLLMLLQMTSAGAMGGGVSSAIARTLGAGEAAVARRLVVHALVIAAAMAGAFTLLLLAFGRPVYALLGGRDASLEAALAYSNIIFGGAAAVWLANTLASVLRGSGNMAVPAVALVAAAVVHLPLCASLVQGAGEVLRPVLAGTARLAIILAGAFLLSITEMLTLSALFALIAAAMLAFGVLSIWAIGTARWVK